MKNFIVCQVADMLSESLLTMFLAPNTKYAETYFFKYAESSLKGADPDDIVLIEYDGSSVFESYSEFFSDYSCSEFDKDRIVGPSYFLLSEVLPDEG